MDNSLGEVLMAGFDQIRQDKEDGRREESLRIKDLQNTYKELVRFFEQYNLMNKELKEFLKGVIEAQKREVRSGRGISGELSDKHILISFQRLVEESLAGRSKALDMTSENPLIKSIIERLSGLQKTMVDLEKAQDDLTKSLNAFGNKIKNMFERGEKDDSSKGGLASGVANIVTPQSQASSAAASAGVGGAVAKAMVAAPILGKIAGAIGKAISDIFPVKNTLADTIKLGFLMFGSWLNSKFGPKVATIITLLGAIAGSWGLGVLANKIGKKVFSAAGAQTGKYGLQVMSNQGARTSLTAGSYFIEEGTGAVRKVVKGGVDKAGNTFLRTQKVSQKALDAALKSGTLTSGGTASGATRGLASLAKGALRRNAIAAAILTPFEAIGYMNKGYSAGRAWTTAGGKVASGLAGAAAGAKLGALAGSLAGPIGTGVGGIVGGLAGFALGEGLGEKLIDTLWDKFQNLDFVRVLLNALGPLGWLINWWRDRKAKDDGKDDSSKPGSKVKKDVIPLKETGTTSFEGIAGLPAKGNFGVSAGVAQDYRAGHIFGSSLVVTSPYGKQRTGYRHGGIDFGVYGDKPGSPITARIGGRVTTAGWVDGFGKTVVVYDGVKDHYYGHLQDITVKSGQNVYAGQLLGHMGNTGHSEGVHTHYEVRPHGGGKGTGQDPEAYLRSVASKYGYSSGGIPQSAPEQGSTTQAETVDYTSSATTAGSADSKGSDLVKTAINSAYNSGKDFDITGTEQFNSAINSIRVQLGKFQQIGMIV